MPIKQKILLVTRPLVPPWDEASKNFAYSLAKSFRNPEFEFHLLTAKDKLDGLGENIVQHPIFRSGHFDFKAKLRLISFLARARHRFDIVHFLFTPTPFNSFLLQKIFGSHQNTIQTIATLREEQWTEEQWKQMFFAKKLVVYTDHSKNKLQSFGFQNVSRVYPGIDLDRFSPKPKDPGTLERLNLSPRDFVVSYAGEYARLGATDMIADMLIAHLRAEIQKNNHLRFLFALRVKNRADQQKKEELKRRFLDAGILDRIRFSDTVSDVAALYNIADIITFPVADMHGKFDVPLVILEAYACGRPVILSDLPIFKEFSNPDISVTIPRGDGEELWETIEALRADEAKRNALGRSARAFVEQNFNLNETVQMYRNAYLS